MSNFDFLIDEEDVREDEDHYLDFDMFNYVYSLVCTIDDYSVVLNPTNKKFKKFDSEKEGNRRIFTKGNSSIFLESTDSNDFDVVMEICDLYKIKHSEIIPCKSYNGDYYQLIIYVPEISPSYPMLIEDYFNSIGVPLEDVMPKKWIFHYRSKMAKIENESNKALKEIEAEKIYQQHVTEAWRRGDIELSDHFQSLVEELKAKDLPYKRTTMRKRFFAEFEDIDEDVDEEPQLKEVELF